MTWSEPTPTWDSKAAGFGGFNDTGFGLGAAVRALVTPQLELNGGIHYANYDKNGSDTAFAAGARFYVTDQFALGANLSVSHDVTAWMVGARFNFGR